MPRPKPAISVHLDAEVLDFFRAGGKGYQTRINAVLRHYMETHSDGGATMNGERHEDC